MMNTRTGLLIFAAVASPVWLAGASGGDEPDGKSGKDAEQKTAATSDEKPAKPVSDERLKEIARTYTTWEQVSKKAQFAPFSCIASVVVGGVQTSGSGDEATHGKKLYYLYAAKPKEYVDLNWSHADATAPVGQVIVKETFKPVEVPVSSVPKGGSAFTLLGRSHPPEYLIDGEKAFKTGEKRELFIMTKVDPATPGTDRGWVYAVLDADGTRVIDSGMIASCMGCHTQQRHDRQFGLEQARKTTEWKRAKEKEESRPKE